MTANLLAATIHAAHGDGSWMANLCAGYLIVFVLLVTTYAVRKRD